MYGLFFLSGFPALLYQIVWQRSLFTIYGVNIQSVTIVVSAFMLGLGLGSLVGGWISERRNVPLLPVFALLELGVGAFGLVSLRLFHFAAQHTAGASGLGAGVVTFGLLLAPTILMGSTLPILTEHLVKLSGNVGRSVGELYFVNTLGSAAACFAAVFFIMHHLGESGSVRLAALFNVLVALGVLALYGRQWNGRDAVVRGSMDRAVVAGEDQTLSYGIALPIAAMAGLVSLGYEILWYRAYSLAIGGRAPAFALLLGFYLAGVAFGSLVSRYLCHNLSKGALYRHIRVISVFVIGANLLSFLVLPAMAYLSRYFVSLSLPLIALAAGLLGATFPLISHAAVKPDRRAGRGLSWLYVSNIVGSTVGSFVVGYILMDMWPIRRVAVAIALTGLALGAAMLAGSERSARVRWLEIAACGGLALGIAGSSPRLFDHFYEKLEAEHRYTPSYSYRDLVETRSGVVAVAPDLTVYGGGAYDGMIKTDLVNDDNLLYRPFSLSYWHAAPKKVLIIGLSTGAWAQVIVNHPGVETVKAIEINPGYLTIISHFPQVASLLGNPKLSVEIDDGRRWLVRNPKTTFDVIVSNTTFHWRANVSNLLSREFLQLIRQHLNPGGVFFYNLTSSAEAELTGIGVFPHALKIGGFLALSDSPFQLDIERWKRVMAAYRIDGQPVLDLTLPEHRRKYDELIARYLSSPQADAIRSRNTAARIVTDDNMGTEWAGIGARLEKIFNQ